MIYLIVLSLRIENELNKLRGYSISKDYDEGKMRRYLTTICTSLHELHVLQAEPPLTESYDCDEYYLLCEKDEMILIICTCRYQSELGLPFVFVNFLSK